MAGIPIPVVYGTARLQANLIEYSQWKSHGGPGSSKKSGPVGQACVIMALCEGPITNIGMVWENANNPADYGGYVQPKEGWLLRPGNGPTQLVWPDAISPQATYPYLAYVAAAGIALPGDIAPNYNWEVLGLWRAGSFIGGGGSGHATGTGTSSSFDTSLTGFADGYFTNGIIEWTGGYNSGYIGQITAYVSSGGVVTVAAGFPFTPQSGDNFSIYTNGDSRPDWVVADVLTDLNHGLGLPSSMIGDWTSFGDYCQAVGLWISPVMSTAEPGNGPLSRIFQIANCAPFWSDGVLKVVPYGDTTVTGNGQTWVPNSTPLYALTDSDFLGDPPVSMQRTPSAQAYNRVTVDYEDRGFQYNAQTQEAKDDAAIAQAGMVLSMPQLEFQDIKIGAVARTVAQLALQRSLYVRNTYTFKLPFIYGLLEPMDLVTLTDVGLGSSPTRCGSRASSGRTRTRSSARPRTGRSGARRRRSTRTRSRPATSLRSTYRPGRRTRPSSLRRRSRSRPRRSIF